MKSIPQARVLALGLAACLALAACAADAAAQAKKSDAVVKAAAKADKPGPDGKQTVTLTLTVERPWHLYANPVGNKDLADVETTITAGGKAKVEKIEYPAGKVVKDAAVGDYKVYEDTVTIKVHLQRAKNDTGPVDLSVKLQACNDKTCLLPATIKVAAP
ncbi:MAG TPA: protein-disulfide reductase DsbD N-terminal domain-containing protein [Gemmataceae bacterium]|jgi:hypothetical protein|nr:protein-disulfide reductase DsbD N-terminal domain-containing protein [Gemmataceae bacterium]